MIYELNSTQHNYSKVKACTLPSDVANTAEYKFIKNSLSDLKNISELSGEVIFRFDENNRYGVVYDLHKQTTGSNNDHWYHCISKNMHNLVSIGVTWQELFTDFFDITDEIGTEYTNDSYSKLENDAMYSYSKHLPGFRFEETDGGYEVTNFYYDNNENTIVIPNTHNNKPLISITITNYCDNIKTVEIPDSITYIYSYTFERCLPNLTLIKYNGTKAQWNNIQWHENISCTVLCTDGEITAE